MKSVPRVVGLLDDEPHVLVVRGGSCEGDDVEVVARDPRRLLAWRCEGVETVKVRVRLAEKGFAGTQVSILSPRPSTSGRASPRGVLDEFPPSWQRFPFQYLESHAGPQGRGRPTGLSWASGAPGDSDGGQVCGPRIGAGWRG